MDPRNGTTRVRHIRTFHRRAHPHRAPRTGSGGASGHGPIDNDDHGRRPERPNGNRGPLLVALGIVAVGAGVIAARVISQRRA